MEDNMRSFTSYLKKSRVALAAIGLGAMLAGTTALSAPAHADWDHHGGGHWDHGDRGRHWDRDDHWRHEGWHRHYYSYYRPGYVFYPGYGYYDPYYEPVYPAYPGGVSFGFNFR
jgi:hypothetical protein